MPVLGEKRSCLMNTCSQARKKKELHFSHITTDTQPPQAASPAMVPESMGESGRNCREPPKPGDAQGAAGLDLAATQVRAA
ncbi:hypothetical protein HOY80DRAFT_1029616 [Tuber brumale]|nr:hypothetical protein HOY80DRAFT_1029616 [Tuber brumale]